MDLLVKAVLFLLAVYGLANAITVLKAGYPIRALFEILEVKSVNKVMKLFWGFWRALFKCPPCLAFWIGLGVSKGVLSPSAGFVNMAWQAMFIDALAASAAAYLLHVVAEKLSHDLGL